MVLAELFLKRREAEGVAHQNGVVPCIGTPQISGQLLSCRRTNGSGRAHAFHDDRHGYRQRPEDGPSIVLESFSYARRMFVNVAGLGVFMGFPSPFCLVVIIIVLEICHDGIQSVTQDFQGDRLGS